MCDFIDNYYFHGFTQFPLILAVVFRTKLLSIPAHFEPPVRTLRATLPVSQSHCSGSWRTVDTPFGVNTDEGGHNHDQIPRNHQTEKSEL